MDIEVLRNFLRLADTLHFTRASGKAFIAQSALSRQIKQLESEVQASLFKRDRRNVELTPAGEYFKTEVQRVLNQLDYAITRAQQMDKGEAGEIRIGYTHSAMQSFLPVLIKSLNQHFPAIRTVLIEMANVHQALALKERKIDISISPNPVIEGDVRSKVLVQDHFAIVLPTNHPIDQSNFESLSQFANESFILPPRTEGTLYVGTIESMCIDAGFVPHIIHETSYANTGIRLVEAGIGITIEPVSGLAGYSGIKFIELKNVIQKAELTMLWLPDLEDEFPKVFTLLNQFKYREEL